MPIILKNLSYRFLYVWRRNAEVFARTWFVSVIPPLLEPIFFFFAFGLAIGSMMGQIHYSGMDFTYRLYLAPAIAAIAIMNYAFFECSYSSFVKMEYQKTFEAIMATPLTLEDIVVGEIFWGATKAVAATLVILAILQFFAPLQWQGIGLLLISAFLGGMFFAGFGMIFTGILPGIEMFNYPVFLIITPMMLLSGTFFPVENFGRTMALASEIFPLTHVTRLVRNSYLGIFTNKEWFSLAYLIVATPITVMISLHFVRKRIIH